ncbi:TonB-dependent siderophore receptor [Methylobacillus methanolivorans]|uniref:TonB-dependent siderophore receptor n=1 Tax=Methylobacillus methanolivorans TaxID=1848927 RepID=A0ABW8GMG7_9PROT
MNKQTKAGSKKHWQHKVLSTMLATAFGITSLPFYLGMSSVIAAETEASRTYDIPPGALDGALSRFAGEAGVVLSFEAEQARHLATHGLKGHYSVKRGFDALLENSGLQAVEVQPGRFTLKAITNSQMQKSNTDTLPEVKVAVQADRDGTTEGTASYRAKYTSTATKLALSPRETPQTVTVIGRKQMDDFGMMSVDDALKTASGVFVYERGANGNDYYSRGFSMQSQYDGMLNPTGISDSNRNPLVDNAFLDRVEVLQGASGLLNGAGSPGGTINLVRKRPTQEFQARAEVQLGSWDQRRFVGDVSGPLTESGKVRGRFVALVDDANSFIDYAFNNKQGVYGIIEAEVTPTTLVSASVQYQKDLGRNHLGVPYAADGSDPGLKRSSFFGNPDSHNNKDYTLYTVGIEQKLFDDWLLKATYMRGLTDVYQSKDSWLNGSLNPTTGAGLSLYQNVKLTRDLKSDALDVHASGPVTLFGRTHELTLGINGSKLQSETKGTDYRLAATIPNGYDFDPNSIVTPVPGGTYGSDDVTRQHGMFAVGRFNLSDSLKMILGSRVSWYRLTDRLGTSSQTETGVVTPYAGLVYDFDSEYSVYASYADIFKPQEFRSANGSRLEPVIGANYEVGIKGELLNKQLNVAAAFFRLEQTNLARADTSIPFNLGNICQGRCYTASDKIVSQGLELNLNGEISAGWNVAAGYTYMHSEYTVGEKKGDRYMTTLPMHSLSLVSYYRIPSTDWSIGGNVRAYGRIYNQDATNYDIKRGGLTIVGLTAKYQINKKTELNLIVNNLFDRRYYATVDSLNYTTFAEPRRIMANLKYQF